MDNDFWPFSKWPPKHGKKNGDVWETFGNSILLLSYCYLLALDRYKYVAGLNLAPLDN